MSIWNLGNNNTQDPNDKAYMYDSNTGGYTYGSQDSPDTVEERRRREQNKNNKIGNAGYNSIWAPTEGGVQRTYAQEANYGAKDSEVKKDPTVGTGRQVQMSTEQQTNLDNLRDIKARLTGLMGSAATQGNDNLSGVRASISNIDSSKATWAPSDALSQRDAFNKLLASYSGADGGQDFTSMVSGLQTTGKEEATKFVEGLDDDIVGNLGNIEDQYNQYNNEFSGFNTYDPSQLEAQINNPYASEAEKYSLLALRANLMGTGLHSTGTEVGKSLNDLYSGIGGTRSEIEEAMKRELGDASTQYNETVTDYLDPINLDAGLAAAIRRQQALNPTSYNIDEIFNGLDYSGLQTSDNTNMLLNQYNALMNAVNGGEDSAREYLLSSGYLRAPNPHVASKTVASNFAKQKMEEYNSKRLIDYLNQIGNKYGKVGWE